ncbi:MAG: cofactor-independent phosphoglycerate mutase [Clostridia bacterium]|nr:cofactor-independent phosphoglycerate mutase [Clostridia bacterium]
MKYLVVLGDGMADYNLEALGDKTPLQAANTPNIDKIAPISQIGLVRTVPEGMKPGSDVANLSVIGYDPKIYYSGRSPLEALSIGVDMQEGDIAVRTNLVTLSGEQGLQNKTMVDYSAGEISTPEAKELIEAVKNALTDEEFSFYAGVSYRHCMIIKNGTTETELTPPHDISGKVIGDYLPGGKDSDKLVSLIERSEEVLRNHPVNLKRIAMGKNPATHVWFWGAGTKPQLDNFKDKYGLNGAIISAVDLLKGIAVGAGMQAPDVEGATGTLSTNWDGKIAMAKKCFEEGCDYVYIHLEAPDECGHQGDMTGKVKAIEKVDYVVGEMLRYLEDKGDFTLAVLPDHATPIVRKTHTSEPIPYLIYKSANPQNSALKYNEHDAQSGEYLPSGQYIITKMLETK